jgi:hypothetical protein
MDIREQEFARREQEFARREQEFARMDADFHHHVRSVEIEKEEMVRSHTLETGELRKKNQYLKGLVAKLESEVAALPIQPGEFSNDLTELDTMTLDDNFWENTSFFNPDQKQAPGTLALTAKKSDAKLEAEKPAASGMLLILLLCGAFVASKSSTSSNSAIPFMSDDIRAASATVLDTLYKDAGVQQADPRLSVNRVDSLEPAPSGAAWPLPSSNHMVGLGSSLDALNHQLVQPTKQQEEEQLFSLTVDQYNSVTSGDFGGEPETSTSQGRRNLEERLGAMRSSNKASVAEVYTRSLMWDKVPVDVVRDFAALVSQFESEKEGGTTST